MGQYYYSIMDIMTCELKKVERDVYSEVNKKEMSFWNLQRQCFICLNFEISYVNIFSWK